MDPNSKSYSALPEFFFSDTFLMQLTSVEDGTIDGWIIHYPIGMNLAESFRGICIKENGAIKFSFFVEWGNPNLNAKVLTAYSGEISESESQKTHIVLEWLQLAEDRLNLGVQLYKGCEVLSCMSKKDCATSQTAKRAPVQRLHDSSKGD